MFWVKILQNCVFEMMKLFILANFELPFYLKQVVFGRILPKGWYFWWVDNSPVGKNRLIQGHCGETDVFRGLRGKSIRYHGVLMVGYESILLGSVCYLIAPFKMYSVGFRAFKSLPFEML